MTDFAQRWIYQITLVVVALSYWWSEWLKLAYNDGDTEMIPPIICQDCFFESVFQTVSAVASSVFVTDLLARQVWKLQTCKEKLFLKFQIVFNFIL